MSYKKRIVLVFLLALLFAAVMFFIKERPFSAGPKEVPEHEHEPGIIEEHEH